MLAHKEIIDKLDYTGYRTSLKKDIVLKSTANYPFKKYVKGIQVPWN